MCVHVPDSAVATFPGLPAYVCVYAVKGTRKQGGLGTRLISAEGVCVCVCIPVCRFSRGWKRCHSADNDCYNCSHTFAIYSQLLGLTQS